MNINEKDKNRIDKWINSASKEEIEMIKKAITLLMVAGSLQNTNYVPLRDKIFKNTQLDSNFEFLILTKLFENGIIGLNDIQRGDPRVGGISWMPFDIIDQPFNDKTHVYIGKPQFVYLEQRMRRKSTGIPEGKDYFYDNDEFQLRLFDGSHRTLDFSNSKVQKPVFESCFFLFRDTGRSEFTKEELLGEYEKITGEKIDWGRFSKIKSDICKSKIKKRPFDKRIKWEFNTSSEKLVFQIIPLSDEPSDDRMYK